MPISRVRCEKWALGRRQQKTDTGGTVHSFVFDGNQPYTEFTPGFTRQTGGFYTYANGTTYFNRADNLTMPRLSTDYTGTVQRTEGVLMGPFGDNFTETLSTLDFTGFAGGFWDSENNGEHFGAREYQNTHGAWLSPDPAGLAAVDITSPQTWNRYAYVMDNPTSYIDPSGLFMCDPDWGLCHGVVYVNGVASVSFTFDSFAGLAGLGLVNPVWHDATYKYVYDDKTLVSEGYWSFDFVNSSGGANNPKPVVAPQPPPKQPWPAQSHKYSDFVLCTVGTEINDMLGNKGKTEIARNSVES